MAEDENRGPWLSTATALFFSWAFLSCCVRIWVPFGRKRSWTHSDTGVVGAAVLAVLHVAANFWAISNGYGRQISQIEEARMENVKKALFTSQLSYIGSTGMTRVSTAFFIGQLTRRPRLVRLSYILAGVAGGWTAVSMLVVALRGELSRPWTVLDGTQSLFHRWVAVESTGLAVEIALWSLSLSLVWGLQMKRQKRMLILAVFGFRLLLIPIIATRLFRLSPAKHPNRTISSITPHILTEAAMDYALVSASITSLKPFLKPFHTGRAVVNTTVGGGAGGGGSESGQGIYAFMLTELGSESESKSKSKSKSESQGVRILTTTTTATETTTATTTATVHSDSDGSQTPVRGKTRGSVGRR